MCMLSSVPSLCNLMDCSHPGSSVHGIFQARILEWVAVSYFKGIFPTQGSDLGLLCFLRQQTDSLPPYHLGSPKVYCRAWQTSTPQAFKQSFFSFFFFFLAQPLGMQDLSSLAGGPIHDPCSGEFQSLDCQGRPSKAL